MTAAEFDWKPTGAPAGGHSETGAVSRPQLVVDSPRPRYVDIAGLLDGTIPPPPQPTVLARSDGTFLFYAGEVNGLVGDPESLKTWIALAGVAEVLTTGGRGLVLDVDHNGALAVVTRLLALGAPVSALREPARFRYADADDPAEIDAIVTDCSKWRPDIVVLDSVGELLPLFGLSSNDADDYTRAHTRVMKPIARTGACVVTVDHLAKNAESRSQGATGTAAKKRVIGGTLLRVSIIEAAAPGQGGASSLTVLKDRHGALRERCAPVREPHAGVFRMTSIEAGLAWQVWEPKPDNEPPATSTQPTTDHLAADVLDLDRLVPPPTSVADVQKRSIPNRLRAQRALKEYRYRHGILSLGDNDS